jgi:phosphohistidine swiveling domain-containing protein
MDTATDTPSQTQRAARPQAHAAHPRRGAQAATEPRVLASDDTGRAPLEAVGGKAERLGALVADGASVPEFFCVTTAVFDDVVAGVSREVDAALAGVDYRDRRGVRAASETVRAAFLRAGLPERDRTALVDAFDRDFGPETLVSVRSSAVGEDSAKDSFAGQLDTYLFVRRDSLVESVLRCFASAYCERALLYRHLRGLPPGAVRAAVVVQRMIESRAAGVLFTANPTTGDTNDVVVSAGLGLGEGVVGGTVECDTYYVNAATGAVRERVVVAKTSRVAFDAASGSGTVVAEVAPADQHAPVLDDPTVRALAAIGSGIAARAGAPQDVEWAVDGSGSIYVLQARPITALTAGRQAIFDNSNVVESYPGLSLPLTFSFVRLGYEVLFRESSRLFGVSAKALEKNHDIYPNLLGLLDGRIYYNITHWYRLFLQLPGLEKAIPAWEKALGIERRFVPPPKRRTVWEALARIPVTIAVVFRLLRNWRALPGMVQRFQASCRRIDEEARARDVASLEAHELLDLAEDYGRDLRPKYSVTVVNDFVTQQLYEVIGRLVARWGLGEPVATRNALLCGERGMDSVEPVRSVVRLAERVRAHAGLRDLFASGLDATAVLARVKEDAAFADFASAVRAHVEVYGDRTLEELKLETRTLADRPEQLVSTLRNYLRGGQSVDDMERREQAIRRGAEEAVQARLRGHALRRAVFRFVLSTCRWGIKTRENLRLARSRSFGIFKRIYRAMGARFAERGLLDGAEDVFYLGIEEIAAHVRGESLTRDVRALVALRKKEYEGFRAQSLAGRIVTHGPVYANRLERALGLRDDVERMQGIGCSPGRVCAPARVVLDPTAEVEVGGEVLVASSTDPGWVFLMVAAGGLVSEKGSVLSHTAIIGRELGIPTVVGVKDATTLLTNGVVVELDGEAGTVTLRPPAGTVDDPSSEKQP